MSTRVTSAITSRKAREKLVRLLFPGDSAGTTQCISSPPIMPMQSCDTDRHSHISQRRRSRPESNSAFTPSIRGTASYNLKRHSYSRLRAAYLQMVHAMHPDKVAHRCRLDTQKRPTEKRTAAADNMNYNTRDTHLQFIELKNAWEEYHASVCMSQQCRVDEGGSRIANEEHYSDDDWEEESFTMFGVGCSFADSPEERDLRNEITEQACRGWFSSGLLSPAVDEGENLDHNQGTEGGILNQSDASSSSEIEIDVVLNTRQCSKHSSSQPQMNLIADDMFVCEGHPKKEAMSERKFLVGKADRFRLRKKR